MIRTEIGEIVISIKKKGALKNKNIDYVFIPSFENLSKLGDPAEIINAYSVLVNTDALELASYINSHGQYILNLIKERLKEQLVIAKQILTYCCTDDISALIGDKKKKGRLTDQSILMIARGLMEYGITGKAKVRVSQRNENKGYTSEFRFNDYINNARIHLGLSFDEAKKLTMTEYIMLIANKYPDNDGFTREEYDKVLADYEKRRQERLAKAAK